MLASLKDLADEVEVLALLVPFWAHVGAILLLQDWCLYGRSRGRISDYRTHCEGVCAVLWQLVGDLLRLRRALNSGNASRGAPFNCLVGLFH
jgi:hypothetical protein